ncbi:hypothetical protein CEXT_731781 [Caerostris extrusa]|uniref:Uncharacterized protein n=1 Tax=Caerostris extrusa TaxID=172846 RepID=A0AAV4NC08_CAEEX|nr:hypothetical protein CEXT_731781 [Caerostris extrusa]
MKPNNATLLQLRIQLGGTTADPVTECSFAADRTSAERVASVGSHPSVKMVQNKYGLLEKNVSKKPQILAKVMTLCFFPLVAFLTKKKTNQADLSCDQATSTHLVGHKSLKPDTNSS